MIEAKATLAQLEKLSADTPADYAAGFNTARDMFAIAALVIKARIADAEKRSEEAVSDLRAAVSREDLTAYDEPADWFFPVRHLLGVQLLKAGKAKEAEAVYREDLKRHPDNGWSLYGLAQALKAQKNAAAAAKVEKRLAAAWTKADSPLTSSAF